MRYAHDHPRDWPTLAGMLGPEDVASFRAFAVRLGVLPELASAEIIEALYADWCQSPGPDPSLGTPQ